MKKTWELQQTMVRGHEKKFRTHVFVEVASFLITIFATHHHLRYSLHSSPDWVDLVSPSNVELWRSSYRS